MRRKDKESHDPQLYHRIMAEVPVGYLGLTLDNGYPRCIPVNFVEYGGAIYFHGARSGEKFDLFTKGPKVGFTAALVLSYLPNYFQEGHDACKATHYYLSACIFGTGTIVDSIPEKAGALQALMEKYQPEGGFLAISEGEETYRASLEKTAVFRIDPVNQSVKVNVGQNEDESLRRRLMEQLSSRGIDIDLLTAAEIEKTFT